MRVAGSTQYAQYDSLLAHQDAMAFCEQQRQYDRVVGLDPRGRAVANMKGRNHSSMRAYSRWERQQMWDYDQVGVGARVAGSGRRRPDGSTAGRAAAGVVDWVAQMRAGKVHGEVHSAGGLPAGWVQEHVVSAAVALGHALHGSLPSGHGGERHGACGTRGTRATSSACRPFGHGRRRLRLAPVTGACGCCLSGKQHAHPTHRGRAEWERPCTMPHARPNTDHVHVAPACLRLPWQLWLRLLCAIPRAQVIYNQDPSQGPNIGCLRTNSIDQNADPLLVQAGSCASTLSPLCLLNDRGIGGLQGTDARGHVGVRYRGS